MNLNIFLVLLLLTFLIIFGCQKKTDFSEQSSTKEIKNKNIPPKGFFVENKKVPGVSLNNNSTATNRSQNNTDPDNGDDPIVLGSQLTNPYSVANMQQAVNTLYGGNYPISATHLYVRFKPSSVEQFMTLEESEDLELQDYPMDYEVIQDGDYYQDPSQGTEDFQWLYTVVQVGYNFPQGIQMEVIESLYLPEDNEILEDMAESMAAGAQYSSTKEDNSTIVQIERKDEQVEVFNYTSEQCPCEPDQTCPVWPDCGIGGGGGGGSGGNDPRIPRGTIEVQDIRTCNFTTTPPINFPVRQARIVCKRWFKIERTYTDDQGLFVSSKKFKNKVKVLLKTKNDNAVVRKIRGIRLWQILFPVKKRLGVFDEGDMANIFKLFTKTSNGHDKELPYWVAVTTHNGILEYRQYAAESGVAMPPSQLKVIITNWGFMRGAGAAPMFNKCPGSMAPNYASFFIIQPQFFAIVNGISQLVQLLTTQVDVLIGYKSGIGRL